MHGKRGKRGKRGKHGKRGKREKRVQSKYFIPKILSVKETSSGSLANA